MPLPGTSSPILPICTLRRVPRQARIALVARFGSFHLTGEARQTETWDGKERRWSPARQIGVGSAGRPRQTIGQAQLGWFRGNSALSSPDQRLTKAE
jgi:hypothetical protein